MAFEKVSINIHRLNESIRDFAKSNAEFYRLDFFKKSMKGATAAVKGLAVAFFLVFALLFLSFAVSLALNEWMDSESGGFFVVAALYLLIALWLVYFGGPLINKMILSKASEKFFNRGGDEEENIPSAYSGPEEKPVETRGNENLS